MDVRLSDEQRALRDAAAHIANTLGPRHVLDLDDAERAAKLDAAVEASGWRELRTPTDSGAPLASAVEVAVVAEELGRGLADTAFLGPTLAAELRRLAGASPGGSAETVAFLPDLSALADAVAIDVARASSVLVLRGDRLAEVPLTGAGTAVDLTRPAITIDPAAAVPLPAHRALTADDLTRLTSLGLALTCADLVGVMRGAVFLACEHARTRRQFGVAVGSFQAVQHRLADAFVALEGSRSAALHAAWAVDASPPDDALATAAVAKAYCARAARAVCEAVIQVHGGMGNTWECLAHLYLRRALVSGDLFGGVGANLARVLHHHGIGAGHGLR